MINSPTIWDAFLWRDTGSPKILKNAQTHTTTPSILTTITNRRRCSARVAFGSTTLRFMAAVIFLLKCSFFHYMTILNWICSNDDTFLVWKLNNKSLMHFGTEVSDTSKSHPEGRTEVHGTAAQKCNECMGKCIVLLWTVSRVTQKEDWGWIKHLIM